MHRQQFCSDSTEPPGEHYGALAIDTDGDGSPGGCVDAVPVDGQCDGVFPSWPSNTDASRVGGDMLPDYLDRDSDSDGDGSPDVFEEDGFSISGGRGVGCHMGVIRDGGPTAVLLLMMLVFGLGIRRYRRN